MQIARLWRTLKMCKRVGTAMLLGGTSSTELGSSAVLCPACPQHGTLPSSSNPLLNTLFVMLDGNFLMKCKERNLIDPSPASGMSYFVKEDPYKEYLKGCGPQKEVCDLMSTMTISMLPKATSLATR